MLDVNLQASIRNLLTPTQKILHAGFRSLLQVGFGCMNASAARPAVYKDGLALFGHVLNGFRRWCGGCDVV